MKRNDIKSLHTMSVADLNKKFTELSANFAANRMQHRSGRLKNVTSLTSIRHDMARVLTILSIKKAQQ